MTSTIDTTNNAQQCDANTSEYRIAKPCEGSNVTASLAADQITTFNFGLDDISSMKIVEGMLVIAFAEGQTLTIENFETAIGASPYQDIKLSDGEVINLSKLLAGLTNGDDVAVQVASLNEEIEALNELAPAAGDEFTTMVTKPVGEIGLTDLAFSLVEGENYNTNFAQSDIKSSVLNEQGQLVITFVDGTTTTVENYASFENAANAPEMTLADGTVISISDILTTFGATANVAEEVTVSQEPVEVAQPTIIEPQEVEIDELALLTPEQLANIETAAGTPTGALGNTGANFGSSISNVGLGALNDVGPIDPTALQFDRPEVSDDRVFIAAAPIAPPTFDANDVFGFEDGAINFGVNASPSVTDGSQYIVVTVSDIPNGWMPDNTDATTANGVFDAANGTWTIRLSPGQSLVDGPTFTTPTNSDEDITPLSVTVTQRDTGTNDVTGTVSGELDVIVDAVADPIDLTASNVNGFEDNPVALDIQASLQDLDGSEEITGVTISGIPDGFTLNFGTNNGGGIWSVPAANLAALELTPVANFAGILNLQVTVTNQEVNLSDTEFNFTNNDNTNTVPFDVTFEAVADAPSLVVDNVVVKEDSSVFMPIEATLQDTDGSETLTITVTNIDPTWTVTTGANNGTYDANTGTWTITLPAGQGYVGGLTFAPPANSDLDMSDINITATSVEGTNSTSSSVTGIVDIITDAVADAPTIDAGADRGVLAGQSVAINISNALTDTDGSETLGDITIAGVPNGYSLSAGTDNGDGTWTVTQTQLNGLMLNTPVTGNGAINLTASVTSTEGETDPDREFDDTDNTATSTDSVTITVSPDTNPPEVTFGPNGSGSGEVLEDGSVLVPITAELQGNTPQQLTVTLTGVPSDWTITTGANNGTYANGTWTITLPEGQNYDGGLTFTPPANSDIDLTGLTVTATATNVATNAVLTSDTTGQVIVDAVADTPTIDAGADSSVTAGQSIALNISNAVTDTDGSETLGDVTISGVPSGYSLSAGNMNSAGVWVVSQSDLANLRLNTPANGNGDVTLTVQTIAIEDVTDTDFDLTNNTATNSDTVTVTINPPLTPPEVTFGPNGSGSGEVLEDGSVLVPITASLTGNAANQQLTVEVTGIPSTWTIATGPNNGSYNATTGTWTITLPANQNYDGGLTFTPPADSDVDLTGLSITASSTNTDTNEVETATVDGSVIVDAVADMPILNVNNANGQEGQPVALNISNSLRDTDGSETLGDVTISGVPNGFSLSAGVNQGNGVWTVSQAQLNGLQLNTPSSFSGSVPLSVSVTTTESVTDTDFNLNNNTATATQTLNVVISDTANPPTLDVAGTHRVLEDGSVLVPFEASLNGNGEEVLTVSVTGIPSGWTITTGANNGTYNASTGTWSITLPAGQNYDGGLTFAPPANSDIDLSNLRVKANAFSPETNTNSSITELVDVIVDAVADAPVIDAGANGSVVAGQQIALNISNNLTDTDGSETLGNVTISGVPSGYSLSAGTLNSNGTWTVTQAQLNGLQLNTPANGNGNITLTASVTSTEGVSDSGEYITSNNTATSTDTVRISVTPDNQPPEVQFGDGSAANGSARVLEDGSVLVPITASLQGDAPQQLSVEVSGIPSSWTITTGANNGTYNASTGTWTITLPAGQDYTGPGLTFRPPADSDVDLTDLSVTATSTNTTTGDSLDTTVLGTVIVDAVADMPILNVNNANGQEGQPVALNISNSLRDTDGSETLGDVTISGVPNGFSLSAGVNQGNGVWTVSQAQLNGLQLNTPSSFSGSVPLSVSVTTTESVTDTDFNLNNNTATATQTLNVVISDTANPPTLDVAGTHRVLEDGSVLVPFEASLNGNGEEVLTVSVTGIPSGWTITTGANNGTYNASTGTWSITLPAGQNYDGGLTFAPPANSDIDLSNLRVKANAFSPETNTNSSITELVDVIVDAVADAPVIDAGANGSVVAGQQIALNISNNLTDTDGSETLGNVTISGVPSGYSLSAGTLNSNGTWTVTQAQLNGLQLNTPANGNGNITLTASVTSTEGVSDSGEYITSNNTATSTDTVRISVTPDNQPPEVQFGDGSAANGSARVLEDGSVLVPITASLQGDAPQQLTVEVSGIPSSWTITTGANNGTYNASTGTWTITLPAGQDYNGGLTFTPPANSDVDLTGLTVTATSTNTTTGESLDTDVNGSVIVDAVADMPNLTARNAAGEDGNTVALDISASLRDTDGSESLSNVTISGVPNGFSLTSGTNQGNGTWSVPVSQLGSLGIRIPNGANPGDYSLNVSVRSTERVTDTDYITSNNVAINNQVITVRVSADDVPVITIPTSPISYERDLGTPNVIRGDINVNYGSDTGEVYIPQNGTFTATGQMAGGVLSSGGVNINVTQSGNTYTGKAGNLTIFTMTVNADGSYVFRQYEPLDNASATNPNERVNLNFQISARDNDGDVTTSTLTVRVQDTGPSLRDDTVTMWSCDWVTRGNVITNSNQDGNGTDRLSVEGPNQITVVDGHAFKTGGDAMVVDGEYGALYIFKDGSYAYVSSQASPQANQTENFSYTVVDGDGDRDTAQLTIDVVKANRTANPDADYGNQGDQLSFNEAAYLNRENNETDIYTTSDTDGAMVFGWTANDELSGNVGDDVLLGWTGNDTLYGRGGNDVLMGEYGSNTLYGGAGADIFVIHSSHALNNTVVDRIMDFNLSQGDVLSLSDVISGFNSNSDINDFVRIEMNGGNATIQVDSYGTGNNFYDVAVIRNHGGINTGALDVQDLYDQGYIDVV
jgi:T1SS-143 domain-containing protein